MAAVQIGISILVIVVANQCETTITDLTTNAPFVDFVANSVRITCQVTSIDAEIHTAEGAGPVGANFDHVLNAISVRSILSQRLEQAGRTTTGNVIADIRGIGDTQLESAETRRVIGDLVGVARRGDLRRGMSITLTRMMTEVRRVNAVTYDGRRHPAAAGQIGRTVLGADYQTAPAAFQIDIMLVDLIAGGKGFQLNLDTDLQAVVEGCFTLEMNLNLLARTSLAGKRVVAVSSASVTAKTDW